jgi:hypothetical protein
MAETSTTDPAGGTPPADGTSEFLHSTGASLHTPESFGRAVIAAALMGMAQSGGDASLDGRTAPATFSIKTLRTATDAPPVCIDVCVSILGAEICIHVVVPDEIVSLF